MFQLGEKNVGDLLGSTAPQIMVQLGESLPYTLGIGGMIEPFTYRCRQRMGLGLALN
jgi:hypothetical protein